MWGGDWPKVTEVSSKSLDAENRLLPTSRLGLCQGLVASCLHVYCAVNMVWATATWIGVPRRVGELSSNFTVPGECSPWLHHVATHLWQDETVEVLELWVYELVVCSGTLKELAKSSDASLNPGGTFQPAPGAIVICRSLTLLRKISCILQSTKPFTVRTGSVLYLIYDIL